MAINTQLRNIEWFVNKWSSYKAKHGEGEGRKVVRTIIDEELNVPLPEKFWKNQTAAWHQDKNTKYGEIAFAFVFDNVPIPGVDENSKLMAEKVKKRNELKAKVQQIELEREIEEYEKTLAEYEAKMKAEKEPVTDAEPSEMKVAKQPEEIAEEVSKENKRNKPSKR